MKPSESQATQRAVKASDELNLSEYDCFTLILQVMKMGKYAVSLKTIGITISGDTRW